MIPMYAYVSLPEGNHGFFTHTHIYIYTHTHMYTSISICLYIYISTYLSLYIHIYTHLFSLFLADTSIIHITLWAMVRLYVDCLQPVAFRGLRCITLDHRGHGASQAPSHGYRLARSQGAVSWWNLPKKNSGKLRVCNIEHSHL